MVIDINALFERGATALRNAGDEREAEKVNTLRAGNTGCLLEDGRIIGACPRRTYLRMKGINFRDFNADRELMLEGGVGNEDLWVRALSAAGESGLSILREEEVPISWPLPSGRLVTGRPDIVVCLNNAPAIVLELKLVSSLWTAKEVAFKLKPKTNHLLQAAHYAWQLDVPAELWYTNRTNFATTGWASGLFPKQDHPYLEHGLYETWYEFDNAAGKNIRKQRAVSADKYAELPYSNRLKEAKSVLPFRQGYALEFDSAGVLHYHALGQAGTRIVSTKTLITKDGIRRYYELVDGMDHVDALPPAPSALEADGSKMSYKPCVYCALKKVHPCSDNTISRIEWMNIVQAYISEHGTNVY